MPVYSRNPRLETFEWAASHYHAIPLDDTLTQLHHMRINICDGVDPGNLIDGEGETCITCQCEHSRKTGHLPKRLANPLWRTCLYKHIAGKKLFDFTVPLTGLPTHDFALGNKAILNNLLRQFGY